MAADSGGNFSYSGSAATNSGVSAYKHVKTADLSGSMRQAGNAAAIGAFGDFVTGAVDDVVKAKEKAAQDEIDAENREWLQTERTWKVQDRYDEWMENQQLGVEGYEGDFKPPAGYRLDNNQIIRDEQVNAIADGIKYGEKRNERRKRRNERRSERGAELLEVNEETPEGDVVVRDDTPKEPGSEYIQGDANLDGKVDEYDKVPTAVYPEYKERPKFRNKTEALAARKTLDQTNSNVETVGRTVLEAIENNPNFSPADNPEIASFATAYKNGGVSVIYNNKTRDYDVVWQGKDGKYHRKARTQMQGTEPFGKPVEAMDGLNVTKALTTNYASSEDIKMITQGKYIGPEGKERIKFAMTNQENGIFKDPKKLESFIRQFKVTDVTGDGKIDAEDAWSVYDGYMSEHPIFGKGWNAENPEVVARRNQEAKSEIDIAKEEDAYAVIARDVSAVDFSKAKGTIASLSDKNLQVTVMRDKPDQYPDGYVKIDVKGDQGPAIIDINNVGDIEETIAEGRGIRGSVVSKGRGESEKKRTQKLKDESSFTSGGKKIIPEKGSDLIFLKQKFDKLNPDDQYAFEGGYQHSGGVGAPPTFIEPKVNAKEKVAYDFYKKFKVIPEELINESLSVEELKKLAVKLAKEQK